MSRSTRKYEAIDLMQLYAKGGNQAWNHMLTVILVNQDLNALGKLRYQIQAGMDDLVRAKADTLDIAIWFSRLIKSLENTARAIIRKRYPMPGDSPLMAKADPALIARTADAKRKRDQELRDFLARSSF